MISVAICDDNPLYVRRISAILRSRGISSIPCYFYEQLEECLKKIDVDCILLDIFMPKLNGIEILERIRKHSSIPIIMLSGCDEKESIIKSFTLGADDFVKKPVDVDELLCRIHAVCRRSEASLSRGVRATLRTVLRDGPISYDIGSRIIEGPLGEKKLTTMESRIMQVLLKSYGVVPRQFLVVTCFNREYDPSDRSIDVHIHNIRSKIKSVTGRDGMIHTVRGQGYMTTFKLR
jgi:DNA-binding response OmpR family regulator